MSGIVKATVTALVVLGCAGAQATDFYLSPPSLSGTNSYSEPAQSFASLATFTDNYNFTVSNRSYLNISLDSLFQVSTVHIPGHTFTTTTGLTLFDATLDGVSLASQANPSSGSPRTTTLTWSPSIVAAGSSHLLTITGTAGNGGGSYKDLTLTLVAAPPPVPEPETYALMLAGLGAIGFLARRRRND